MAETLVIEIKSATPASLSGAPRPALGTGSAAAPASPTPAVPAAANTLLAQSQQATARMAANMAAQQAAAQALFAQAAVPAATGGTAPAAVPLASPAPAGAAPVAAVAPAIPAAALVVPPAPAAPPTAPLPAASQALVQPSIPMAQEVHHVWIDGPFPLSVSGGTGGGKPPPPGLTPAQIQAPYSAAAAAIAVAGQKTGQIAGAVGALKGPAAVESALGALSMIPGPVGVFAAAVNAATGAVSAFAEGVSATANRLAPYSAPLSGAQANAEVMQILKDIERADRLGTELTAFIDAKSELSQTWQDAMADLLKPLIPLLTGAMKLLMEFIEWVRTEVPNHFVDAVNTIIEALNSIINLLPWTDGDDMIDLLKRIERKTPEPEVRNGMEALIDSLLALRQGGAQPLGGAVLDPRLNIPLGMGGF